MSLYIKQRVIKLNERESTFPADQQLKSAIDYGSGNLGIISILKRINTGEEYNLIFKEIERG